MCSAGEGAECSPWAGRLVGGQVEVTRGSSGERTLPLGFEGERDSGEAACFAASVCFREDAGQEWSRRGDRVCFVEVWRPASVGRGGEPPVCDLKVSESAVERELCLCGCVSEEWR